jgi:hypothetical protein
MAHVEGALDGMFPITPLNIIAERASKISY